MFDNIKNKLKLKVDNNEENNKGQKKKMESISKFEAEEYDLIPIGELESMYVDRLQNTARLMVKKEDGKEFSIARFSLGFAEKFEQFSERVNLTKKGEPIDDALLENQKTHCPNLWN